MGLLKKTIGVLCALVVCVYSLFGMVCPISAAEAESYTELVRIDFSSDTGGAAALNSVSATAGISWFSAGGGGFYKRGWGSSTTTGNISIKHTGVNWPRYFTLGKDAYVKGSDPLVLDAGKYSASFRYLPDPATNAGGISVCLSKAWNSYSDVICKGGLTFAAKPGSYSSKTASFDFSLTDQEYEAGYQYVMIMLTPKTPDSDSDRITLWIDDIVVSKSSDKDNKTAISFEHENGYYVYTDNSNTFHVKDLETGIYDYNDKYFAESTGLAAWYKVTDPTDSGNTCMRGVIGGNDTSHFSVTLADSSTEGYRLYDNTSYIVTYRYRTEGEGSSIATNIRGAARSGIGAAGSKSVPYANTSLALTSGEWKMASFRFTVPEGSTATYPYLLLVFGGQPSAQNLKLYIDDIEITESIFSHSLVLAEEIGVNFFMDLSALTAEEKANSYMTFAVTNSEDELTVGFSDAFTSGNKTGFKCYLNSVQIADTITPTFHYSNNKTLVGESFSLSDYTDYILSNSGSFSESVTSYTTQLSDCISFIETIDRVNDSVIDILDLVQAEMDSVDDDYLLDLGQIIMEIYKYLDLEEEVLLPEI